MQDLYDAIEKELSIILTERERMIAARATTLMNKVNSDVVIRPVDFYVKTFKKKCYYNEAERTYKIALKYGNQFNVKVDFSCLTDRTDKDIYKYVLQGRKSDVKMVLKMI